MNCFEIEVLICEYVDGSLAPVERAEVESHLAECPACAELARDSSAAVGFIERAADVDAPPELITRILFDAPWQKARTGWFPKTFHSVLQPKFAMSMALTIFSFSMLWGPARHLNPADLQPTLVWAGLENRAYLAWARTVKFYDNLKFVYQIQTTLREWQQDQEAQAPAPDSAVPSSKPDDHRLSVSNNARQAPAPAPKAAGR